MNPNRRGTVFWVSLGAAVLLVLLSIVFTFMGSEMPCVAGCGAVIPIVIIGVGLIGFTQLVIDTPDPPAGACERCRYDRRGLPSGAPCPECGHRPPAEQRGVA